MSSSCGGGGSPSEAIEELVQPTNRLGESNPATSSQTGGWTPVQSIQIRESRGEPYGAYQVHSRKVNREVHGAGAHRCRVIEWVEWKVPTCSDGAWSASWVQAATASQPGDFRCFPASGPTLEHNPARSGHGGSRLAMDDSGKVRDGTRRATCFSLASHEFGCHLSASRAPSGRSDGPGQKRTVAHHRSKACEGAARKFCGVVSTRSLARAHCPKRLRSPSAASTLGGSSPSAAAAEVLR